MSEVCFKEVFKEFQGCLKNASIIFLAILLLHSSQLPEQKDGLFCQSPQRSSQCYQVPVTLAQGLHLNHLSTTAAQQWSGQHCMAVFGVFVWWVVVLVGFVDCNLHILAMLVLLVLLVLLVCTGRF